MRHKDTARSKKIYLYIINIIDLFNKLFIYIFMSSIYLSHILLIIKNILILLTYFIKFISTQIYVINLIKTLDLK